MIATVGRMDTPAGGDAIRSAQLRRHALLCSVALAGSMLAARAEAAPGCGPTQPVTTSAQLAAAFNAFNSNSGTCDTNVGGPITTSDTLTATGYGTLSVLAQPSGGGTPLITGTGGLDLEGFSTTVLIGSTGITTYSGDTVIGYGTLQAGATNAFSPNSNFVVGNGSGQVSLELNGYDQRVGSVGSANGGVVQLGGGTLTTGLTGRSTTFGGTISGTGGLTLDAPVNAGTSAAVLTLTSTNDFTGPTTINAGTVVLRDNATVGGSVVVNRNAAGTVAGTLAFVSTGDTARTFGNTISGGGAVTVQGVDLTLTGDNATFAGNVKLTAIDPGVTRLAVGSSTALGSGLASVTVDPNTTFDLSGYDVALSQLFDGNPDAAVRANESVLLNGGTLTLGTGQGTNTFYGTIADGDTAGNLVKVGNNTLLLGGQNTFSGQATLRGGTVRVTNDASLGTAALLFDGGTLQVEAGSGSVLLGNTTTVTTANGTIDSNGESLTLSGNIAGYGGLTFNDSRGGGITNLGGNNNYQGATQVQGGVLQAGSTGAFSNFSAFTVNSTLDLNGYGNGVGSLAGFGTVTNSGYGNASLTTGYDGTSTTFNGRLTDGEDGTLGLVKVGDGTFVITGTNSYSGGTNIQRGVLAVGASGALGTGGITIIGNATLRADADATLGNAVTLTADSDSVSIVDTQANTLRLDGVVSGETPLFKLGSGTLVLSNANDYTGGTIISAGTVAAGDSASFGTGTLYLDTDTNLTFVAGGLNIANDIAFTFPGDPTVDTAGFTETLSGTISGDASLTKAGAGTLILTAANTYTGGTTINAGALQIAAADAIGTGALTFDGGALQAGADGLTINNAATLNSAGTIDTQGFTLTYAGAIGGAGQLVKAGAGTLVLNAANSYAGGTALNAGVVAIGNAGALGTGALTFNGGTLRAGVDGLSLGNAVILAGNGAVDTQGFGLTLSGAISGNGQLEKDGTGTLLLSGANSYAGGTALNAGTLAVGTASALGSGRLTVNAGTLQAAADGLSLGNAVTLAGDATVDSQGFGLTLAGVVDGYGQLTKVGTGTLTLSATNSYAGGTVLNTGTLAVGATGALGAGRLTVNAGTLQAAAEGVSLGNAVTLAGDATVDSQGFGLTLAGVVDGYGQLTKVGTGVLTLAATNSYAGGTVLNAGTVTIGSSGALGTGRVTFNGGALRAGMNGLTVANDAELNSAGTIDTQAFTLVYTGTIAGEGQLVKVGSGTLALNAANSYAGGTALNAGTIAIGNAGALGTGTLTFNGGALQAGADGLTVTNAATLASAGTLDTQGFTLTYAGAIDGPGQLAKAGTGTLVLNAANSYAGGTALNAGTIAIGNAGALGTGTLTFNGGALQAGVDGLTVTNGATLASAGTLDPQGFTLAYAGAISGSGQLAKAGTGTLVLNAANSYAGGTALNAGTIAVGNAGALGTGTLTFNGGTLQAGADGLSLGNAVALAQNGTVDTQGFGLTLAGTVSGAAGLTKVGTGTLLLSGANSYAGGTTLVAGTLAVGNSTALGTGPLTMAAGTLQAAADGLSLGNAVALARNGTVDTQGFGLTLAGTVSGGGRLTKIGSGTLALNAANSYAGGTALNAGTIAVGNAGALGTGAVSFNGGALRAGADGLTIANAATLNSAGTLDTQGFTLTYAGAIGGSGQLTKAGTGTLVLNAANSYAGGTALNAGTVAVGNAGALGTGTLTFNGGALQAGVDGLTIANAATLASAGTLDTQAFTLTYTGAIGGPGQLIKAGTGTLVLNAANSYADGTALNAGTVAVGNAGALGTGTLTFNGGALQAGVDGLTVTNAATLASAGTLDTQNFTLTYAGAISGLGQLAKAGTGTLVLNAANSYAGGTALNAGTIAIGNAGALGTGTLTFNGGALQAGVDGLTVTNGATLASAGTLDTQGFILAYAGTIGGSGQLIKAGTGTLVLNAANSYAGGTALNAGTIAVGNAGALGTGTLTFNGGVLQAGVDGLSLGNAVALAQNGTVDTQGFGLTLAGTVSGEGRLTKTGTGALTLTSANSYTGGTALLAGTLAVGNAGALGSGPLLMDDGTTLAFTADDLVVPNDIVFTGVSDPTVDTGPNFETLSGSISGRGDLTKLGSGTLLLTGINTYTGATTVAAGTLLVDGSVGNSAVTVNNGATIGGGGTLGSLALLGGSTLTSAVGRTVSVNGNVTFAPGSTYQVTVNGDGSSSRLNAGGSVTVNGATLDVNTGTGQFSARTYTLLSAGNGVTGSFNTVNTDQTLALLSPSVNTAADAVTLTLAARDFPTVASTRNQVATARAIQALGAGNPLYDATLSETQAGAQAAFNSASGIVHADLPTTILTVNRLLTTFIVDRIWDVSGSGLSARQVLDGFAPDRLPALVRCYGPVEDTLPAAPAQTYTAWGTGFGSFGHNDASANAGSLDRTLGGFVLGVDQAFDNVLGSQWRAGVAGGYTNTGFASSLDAGNGTVQGVFGSLYGGARYGNVNVRLGSTFGGVFTDTSRTVVAPGFFSETERGSSTGVTVQGFGEVGYRFVGSTPTGGSASAVLEPVAGASFTHIHQDGFTERGGAAALVVAARDYELGTTTLGFRGELAPIQGQPFVAHGLLAWQHAIGDVTPSSVLAFAANPGNTFNIVGVPLDRDALAAEAALDYRTSADMNVGVTYTGLIGRTSTDHSVKGRMEYRF